MAADKIGDARCPLCRGTARVSLAKSGLVVLTMNCCQAQLFTRSERSDELVRGLILPEPKAAEPAPAAPAVQAAPAAAPAPAAPPLVQEKPAPGRSPFAMFGA